MVSVDCQVCGATTSFIGAVSGQRKSNGSRDVRLPNATVRYHLCDKCGYCFAPQMHGLTNEPALQMSSGYEAVRFVYFLEVLLGESKSTICHLDCSGGSSRLSPLLGRLGWATKHFNPYDDSVAPPTGIYDLVTAFGQFPRVTDVQSLILSLNSYRKLGGVILFDTALSDGEILPTQPLTWSYAAPGDGHISLHSKESLRRSLAKLGLSYWSISPNLHLAFRAIPAWARHLVPAL